MVSKTYLIALLSLASLIPTDLPAQDSGCTRRTVAVGVVDSAWNLVSGLSAANFHGSLRGHDVEILSASIDRSPRHIVLLLDASGSMIASKEAWEAAKSASQDLIRFAPARAAIAQIAFSEGVLDRAGFDEDRSAALNHLAVLMGVPRGGRTALYDAISSGLSAFGVLDFGDAVCAVTDGEDNKSHIQPRSVEEDLLRLGVRLFSVVMNHRRGMPGPTPEETEDPYRLWSLVEASGGNGLTLPFGVTSRSYPHVKAKTSQGELDLALQRMFQQMGEFYRLDLRTPATVEKPTKRKLEVIDASGRPMRGVEVHYPQELMPCANVGG